MRCGNSARGRTASPANCLLARKRIYFHCGWLLQAQARVREREREASAREYTIEPRERQLHRYSTVTCLLPARARAPVRSRFLHTCCVGASFRSFIFFFFFGGSDLDRFGVRFFFLFQRRGEIRKKIGPSDNDLRSDEKKWHMVVRAGHEGVNTTWKRTTADAPK